MADTIYNYNNLEQYMNQMGLLYDETYMRWVKDIINTKISMFEYDDLPSELTSEIMERALMFNNFLCFADIPGQGVMLCRWRTDNIWNYYMKPISVNLMALNGKPLAYKVPYDDIVLVRDNSMDIIPFLTLNGWINKIIEKEKTLDSIFNWISLPTIISGDKEQVSSLKNLMKKASKREPFIVAAKNYKDHIEQFDLRLPVQLSEVYDILKKYRGLTLASMGIYEVDEKRERIVTAEIKASNDYVDFVYQGMYNERKRFVEECNRKFGTNIKLRETYVENQEDDLDITAKTSIAEAQGDLLIEEAKQKGEQDNDTNLQ